MSPTKQNRLIWFAVLSFVALFILGALYFYQRAAVENARLRAYGVLRDSAAEQRHALSLILDGHYSMLESFADSSSSLDYDRAELTLRMSSVARSYGYLRVALADRSGFAFASDGSTCKVGDAGYFAASIAGGRGLEKLADKNDVSTYVFSVPYGSPERGVIGVLYAVYSEESFRSVMINEAFGGLGYSFICAPDGEVISNSRSSSSILHYGNILTLMSGAEFEDGSFEGLRAAIAGGEDAVMAYKLDGERRYAVCQPMDVSGWVLMNVVPGSAVDSETDTITGLGLFFTASIFAAFLAAAAFILANDQRHARQLELYRSMEDSGVFTVEATRELTLVYGNDRFFAILGCTAQELRTRFQNRCGDFIAPEDMDALERERLAAGEDAPLRSVIRLTTGGGTKYVLTACTPGRVGRRQVLSGTIVDITEQKETALELQVQKELTDIALADSRMRVWEYDYAARTLRLAGVPESDPNYGRCYENYPACFLTNGVIDPADLSRFMDEFARLEAGARSFTGIFRMKRYNDGELRYYSVSFSNIFDANGRPCRAVSVSRDVTSQHIEELTNMNELRRLSREAERDSMTGLLNHRATFERISSAVSEDDGRAHALIMVDIDDFKSVNDVFGHQEGDYLLMHTASAMKGLFRGEDILGRTGGDEFMILMLDVPSADFVRRRAEELVDSLRYVCDESERCREITSSAGAVVFKGARPMQLLYKAADDALYAAKQQGKNRCCVRELAD